MRRQLQKAAPHALRPPTKTPAAGGASQPTRKPAARPARAAAKAVVNGHGVGGDDWEEF